ncbi:MAG: prolyl oligopeptidase family serine peptidase, partial [Oligoflexia bacterium]|nr:prolyl oligopeptidase family serine peptidase [Oligoflexia bacterium]
DKKFNVYLNKTLSNTWVLITAYSALSSEYHYLPANQPLQTFKLFCAREKEHEYHVYYGDGIFYILTNKNKAFNFKLMKVSENKISKEKSNYPNSQWEELITHRPDVFIEGGEVFKEFIALNIRKEGRQKIEIYNIKKSQLETVDFKEDIYSVVLGHNAEYGSDFLRLSFETPVKPLITYDYNWKEKKLHFKRQMKYAGDFSSENYKTESQYALANNGVKIPLSLVYKKDLKITTKTPLLLYGYGSYGYSLDPRFNPYVLSLLNRGFIYATAHIRGGSERGRLWYEEGKFLKKKNTFTDFIACAEHLIEKSYSSPEHLYIMGESAGGLLMGAVLNERPDLFHGAVARVPFVDCLATMLDEHIPLTTGEYEEWGNPNEKAYYDYIKSYSPYNNIRKTNYPHLLIETGYHDPRVQYWEPVKWAAKLREYKTNNNLIAMTMNMDSGHFGSTGQFEYFKLYSLCYSFLIGLEQGLI